MTPPNCQALSHPDYTKTGNILQRDIEMRSHNHCCRR
jgi:hypothetical protein